jgi:hypothetical protein
MGMFFLFISADIASLLLGSRFYNYSPTFSIATYLVDHVYEYKHVTISRLNKSIKFYAFIFCSSLSGSE